MVALLGGTGNSFVVHGSLGSELLVEQTHSEVHPRIKRGGGAGGPNTLKNHKNIGFLSSPKNDTKLPNQHSMSGHHQHASETPFKWRFAVGPMMLFSHKNNNKQNRCKVGPPLAKLSGSTHEFENSTYFV